MDRTVTFTVPGEPASKARARFDNRGSKVRTYTPESTKAGERLVAWRFREAASRWDVLKEPEFRVEAVFYPGTRQRRDVDNMLKLVLDGLNKVAWDDDRQVTDLHGRIVFNDPTPRTVVTITELEPQGRLTKACDQCGKPFQAFKSLEGKTRFCSPECRKTHQAATRPVGTCPTCGAAFTHKNSKPQTYCSLSCAKRTPQVVLTCPTCLGEFAVLKSQATKRRFCSNPCRRGAPPGRGATATVRIRPRETP